MGVNGADCILDNLLGPSVAEPDLTRLCDIMFPDGDVTTFDVTGSEDPRSRFAEGNRGVLKSVGVGGVFTMIGATSPVGGVEGGALISVVAILAVRGLSGVDVGGGSCGEMGTVCDLSGNKCPSLDETLPRRCIVLSAPSDVVEPPTPDDPLNFLSGLAFGLELFFVFKASRSLPTGDGDRLCDSLSGARKDRVESEVDSLLIEAGSMLVRGVCVSSI